MTSGRSRVVEHLPHHPKVKGSSPVTATGTNRVNSKNIGLVRIKSMFCTGTPANPTLLKFPRTKAE
jgi:hypothetical protein